MKLRTGPRFRRLLGCLATLAAAAFAVAPTTASAAPNDPLGHEGRWITDGQGRVVTLHGFNMVNKRAPYYATDLGFGEDDARFLHRNGFNTIRLGVAWEGVEPEPGIYDQEYIDRIASEVEMLAEHDIHTLLDFHQDQWASEFQGNGFPEWTILDDGLPREPRSGFPLNYYRMPALQQAFDSFWENRAGPGGVGLQDRYAAAWQQVVERVRGLPGIVGYDLMNEPWPGSRLDCSSWEGCEDFDRGPLADFNERIIGAIREIDDDHLVWHEPLLPYDYGAQTYTADTGDDNAGFSFHLYCIGIPGFAGGESRPCDEVNPSVFEQADAVSERTGDALLMTEFGANISTPGSIVEATRLADEHMIGWQEWEYDDNYSDQPGQALVFDPSAPPRGANVDRGRLELLARPYPQLVAGTPKSWNFDPETGEFELTYRTRGVTGKRFGSKATTRIAMPRLQYPDGYLVAVKGAAIRSQPGARALRIEARKGAKKVVLSVSPQSP